MPCPFCQKEHTWSAEEALEMLAQGPQKVRAALAGASDRELTFAEPKPGGWTPAQVATHLMDTEVVYSLRFRKLLAEEDPTLPAFDQNRWAEALLAGRQLNDVLQTYQRLRKQNLGLRRAAPAGTLDSAGIHPQCGRLTLRDHLIHMADHDSRHAAQIRRIRDAYARSEA